METRMDIEMKKITICFMIVALGISSTRAQNDFEVKFLEFSRNDAGLAYNFCLGEDAERFATTIDGFGSGFMFDAFTGRYSVDMISVGFERARISLGAGVAINKYRFRENLVFVKLLGNVVVMEDPAPNRDYVNTFFGYGKSKLVYGSFYFPLDLTFRVGPMMISGGAFVDQYLSGKYKMKYLEDGEKMKEVIRNKDWREYNLQKTKWGVNAMIAHTPSGIGVSFAYMLTPFFTGSNDPVIHEARISLFHRFGIMER
ncbi:MAG TPA: hypothetical protein ENN63_10060 [Bacteroidetes bacterium]|nr:hypothetical protein [Bacteroidota bacterium]